MNLGGHFIAIHLCKAMVAIASLWIAITCFPFTEVVVSPPFVFLPLVKSTLRPDFHVAAQNCWVKKGGAFTGEIRYVLICSE